MDKVENDQLLCHKCLCKCPVSEFSEESIKGDMPICNTCLSELDGGKPLDPSIRAMTKIKCSRCRCWKYEREFSNPADTSRIMRTCNSCRRRNKPSFSRSTNHSRVTVKREVPSSPESPCKTDAPVKTEPDPKIAASASLKKALPARPLVYPSQFYPSSSTIKPYPPYSVLYPQFMKPFPTTAESTYPSMASPFVSRSLPTGVCGIPFPYPAFPRPYPSSTKEVCAIPVVNRRSLESRLPSRQFVEAGDVTELTYPTAEIHQRPSGASKVQSQLDILAALSMRELSSINEVKPKSTVSATTVGSSGTEKQVDSVA